MRKKGRVVALILLTSAGVAGTAAYAGLGRPEPIVSPSAEVRAPAERVRVEVLNAGGVSGRARDATAHVRDAGFDVVAGPFRLPAAIRAHPVRLAGGSQTPLVRRPGPR